MKFTIDTSSFSRELFKVMGIAGSKSTMPILHNALLEAHDDGSVTIAATDNELTVVTRASAGVESPGRVTVRAKDLYDVVKGIRSESVNVTAWACSWWAGHAVPGSSAWTRRSTRRCPASRA
jgi:DNA polymerase-3 subunit beta